MKQFCKVMQIKKRRLQRWLKRGNDLTDKKPGFLPGTAPHGVTSEERSLVIAQAKKEEHADDAHRILAYNALDENIVHVSPSTFYRIMKEEELIGYRGCNRGHKNHKAPIREDLTGPLQRICWDVSYIRTNVKYTYLYLYLILDEWSRKALQWAVEWELGEDVAKGIFSDFFIAEGIIDLPDRDRPVVINDRGGQMKAVSVKQMFVDMKMDQRFTRPGTPNDNPFVESSFSTLKRHPNYPDRFVDRDAAIEYFEKYFRWYNFEHLHGKIGFVTPDQKHSGLADQIISERAEKLKAARINRLASNRLLKNPSLRCRNVEESVIL